MRSQRITAADENRERHSEKTDGISAISEDPTRPGRAAPRAHARDKDRRGREIRPERGGAGPGLRAGKGGKNSQRS
jgi:hypothetical protein